MSDTTTDAATSQAAGEGTVGDVDLDAIPYGASVIAILNGQQVQVAKVHALRYGLEIVSEQTRDDYGHPHTPVTADGRPLKPHVAGVDDHLQLRADLEGRTVAQLKDDIKARNKARAAADPAADPIPSSGTKDELVDALVAADDTTDTPKEGNQ